MYVVGENHIEYWHRLTWSLNYRWKNDVQMVVKVTVRKNME